jgi:hypothetical protein
MSLNDDDLISDEPPSARDDWDQPISDPDYVPELARAARDHVPLEFPQFTDNINAKASSFESDVRQQMDHDRVRQEARRRLQAEERGATEPPEFFSLDTWLQEPSEAIRYRLEGLQPKGTTSLLTAQAKTGKTTFINNLVRSYADGEPFLGKFSVTPLVGRIALVDTEMNPQQLREWLREQQIRRADRISVVSLRGRVSSFNILDACCRAEWAARFRRYEIELVIGDCISPIFDVLGLDEWKDPGQFFVAWNALLLEAGINESVLVHHAGHHGERARGHSSLRDRPDVLWHLTRANDDPGSPRSFAAYGRDVEVGQTQLEFDAATRRLTFGDPVADRAIAVKAHRDKKALLELGTIVRWLVDGQRTDLSGRQIKEGLNRAHSDKNIDAALHLGTTTGDLIGTPGSKRATLYRVAPESPIARAHLELKAFLAKGAR